MLYAQLCINSLSIYSSVYIVYIHSNKSKLLLESIEVSIRALGYLSHCCHTSVTLFFGAM